MIGHKYGTRTTESATDFKHTPPHRMGMQSLHNGPFANQINDKLLQSLSDRRINYAENVASLGRQITRKNVLRKAILAIIVVYIISFHLYDVNRSLCLINQLVLMSTPLRKIQMNSLSMQSQMPIIILNVNPTTTVRMITCSLALLVT